jgi:alanine racemase
VYSIQTICSVVKGSFIRQHTDDAIQHLVYDSRRVQQPGVSLFFAIQTELNDGHKFIGEAYRKGVRNFIVSKKRVPPDLAACNIVLVENTLQALQRLAAHHRIQFHYPVIGITGSNGKTIVKEWLYQLLQSDMAIVRSPKSFNSQLGVPLSVWQMTEQYDLGLFEAGISTTGEMEKLEDIIRPTIGLLTNIGEAHDAGFASHQQKMQEKLKLFKSSELVIGEHVLLRKYKSHKAVFTWGSDEHAQLRVVAVVKTKEHADIRAVYQQKEIAITIPFTDDASIQNALHCWCVLLHFKTPDDTIQRRFLELHTVDMRLQLKHGINDCLVVNDSYSADLTSLKIALDFLRQQSSGLKRTAVLSDFFETGKTKKELYPEIASLLKSYKVQKLIAIGPEIGKSVSRLLPNVETQSYSSTEDLLAEFKGSSFFNEIILIKGARKYGFERVAGLFEKKRHQTVLEINLNALAHNLKEYQKLLNEHTKIMAMVKAFSYGSGGAEIASVLQYYNVQYLGVAYADEGVELIKSGISVPVMVMNAEESSFQAIVDYELQPVIYSFELLHQFEAYLKDQGLSQFPVHLEIETGMNRLGFPMEEIASLARHLAGNPSLKIQSVFSHLAASEDPAQDDFTRQQFRLFEEAVTRIKHFISYPFLQHISNSAAIVRHPELQLDMVRLGIGLYGVEIDNQNLLQLLPVATLRSTVAQLKHLKTGESVSYNRRGVVKRDSVIATVRIGYADGYSRQFGNGRGKMWINGKLAPVIGTVCMDMTMIDVTDIPETREGDDVILFGAPLPVQQLAEWIHTIPYEIMTGVSHRVKRIYFHE